MLIAQISDTHIQAAAASTRARIGDLARTVAAINALAERPDVVLHTGDIAHDATAEDYAAARAEMARLACPVYATVGNRDRRAPFRAAFGGDGYLEPDHDFAQYAVDLGPLRIVAVDTHDTASALGGFCAERARGLGRLLAAAPGQPTLVFLHHPPVVLAELKGPSLQFGDAAEAAALADRVAAAGDVIGVVAGHVHRSRTAALGGVMLSTMPAVAVDLNREQLPASCAGRPVFHLHRVTGRDISTASVVA